MFLSRNLRIFGKYTRSLYKICQQINQIQCPPQMEFIKLARSFSSSKSDPNEDSEETNDTTTLDINSITKGDKELEHKLQVIMLEAEVLRQEGKGVPEPDFINAEMWGRLLELKSRSARMKYLDYLFRVSKKKESRLAKKLEKRVAYETFKEQSEPPPRSLPIEEHALKYGLLYNNIFIRFVDTTINRLYNSRLIQAMLFGQKLVIDCGYDQNMTTRENQNTAKQLMLLFSDNRSSDDPFDVHFANLHKQTELEKMLKKYIPTLYDADFPLNIHEKSYTDLFPKEKLVYLTPHCRDEMTHYDHDAIYIIGAIVDKVNQEPLSLAKAKKEGMTMKKFPLDRYLQWGSGSGKSLTINQCVAILNDMKVTGDWEHALRHVPKRKLMDTHVSMSRDVVDKREERKVVGKREEQKWRPGGVKSRLKVRSLYDE